MTSTSTTSDAPVGDGTARRARGATLVAGGVLVALLIEGEVLARYWFVALTGLVYLAAAVVGRSRGTLWAPGLVVTAVGVTAALWLRDGRPVDSFQFVALAVLALGLGGVLAALLGEVRGFSVSAMSVAMPVLLFGAFALLEQQAVRPFAGSVWVYAGLLVVWGLTELLRPVARR